jgi:hypothetical protein
LESETVEELRSSIESCSTLLLAAGCYRLVKNVEDKEQLANDFCAWWLFGRTNPAIEW